MLSSTSWSNFSCAVASLRPKQVVTHSMTLVYCGVAVNNMMHGDKKTLCVMLSNHIGEKPVTSFDKQKPRLYAECPCMFWFQ